MELTFQTISDREKYIISVFKSYTLILRTISESEGNPPTYEELRKKTGYSNGKIYNTLKDIRNLGLVIDNYGLRMTDLGRRWLSEIHNKNTIEKSTLKEACLNVPIFKKIYEEYPEEKSFDKLNQLFVRYLPQEKDTVLRVAAIRYLEGMHSISVNNGRKKGKKVLAKEETKESEKNTSLNTYIELHETLNKIVAEHGEEVIIKIIKLIKK